MLSKSPRVRPDRKCRICGNVLQKHTLNQMEECTAIMKLDISARDAAMQGKAACLKDRVSAQQILARISAKEKKARARMNGSIIILGLEGQRTKNPVP